VPSHVRLEVKQMSDATAIQFSEATGNFTHGRKGPKVPVYTLTGPQDFTALAFETAIITETDGSPKCYAPPGSGLKALDHLANAVDKYKEFEAVLKSQARGGNPGAAVSFLWKGVFAATEEQARRHGLKIDQRAFLKDNENKYPVIQTEGPGRGYYVSTTAMYTNSHLPAWKQQRYVDASTVPYAAITPGVETLGR